MFIHLHLLNDEHLPVIVDGLLYVTVFYQTKTKWALNGQTKSQNCVPKLQPIKIQPVPMNMTACLCPSTASTLSTTIRVSREPLLTSSGPPVRGRAASSMSGRSLMNWRVLSGRSRDRFIPIFCATLLMHWNGKLHLATATFFFF